MLSAQVLVGLEDDCHAIRAELENLLEERFEIAHTTLQVEHLDPQEPITVEELLR